VVFGEDVGVNGGKFRATALQRLRSAGRAFWGMDASAENSSQK
jgi:hypothetical protein